MEFSGSVLTPEQINKAGTKAMPGKLPSLSKSSSKPDHIPMDLTVSSPMTWISFGDSLLFLCLLAKSWNVLEEPGFSSSFLCCPTARWLPEGAMVLPSGEFLTHSTPDVLIKVRTWARHSQPFSCIWEFFPVILDGSGQFTTLWISGIVISRLSLASTTPP